MRVLHLIDARSPESGRCTLRLAADAVAARSAARDEVLVVGGGDEEAAARRCGLEVRGRIGAPLGHAALSSGALRAYLSSSARAGRSPDLVHAWSLGAAVLATAAARGGPIVASAVNDPSESWSRPLLRVVVRRLGRCGAMVLATSEALRSALVAAGLPERRASVLAPCVDARAVRAGARDPLRRRWGLGEGTFAVGLLVEPVVQGDAWAVADAIGRLALAGRDTRLVVAPGASGGRFVRSWFGPLRLGGLIVVEGRAAEPWSIVEALDAGVVATGGRARRGWNLTGKGPPSPGVLPALWAMAGGVPVVAEACAATGPIAPACVGGPFPAGDVNAIARRLLRLMDEPRLAESARSAGRALVEERFGPQAFREGLAAAYGRACSGSRSCAAAS